MRVRMIPLLFMLLAGAVTDLYLIFRKAAVEKKHEP